MKNYYEILNISPASNQASIKKAYLKLAQKFHPDKNRSGEAVDMFKKVSEAYQVLSHVKKREEYDQSIQKQTENRFSKKNSQKPKRPSPPPDLDAYAHLNLTLEEAFLGCEKHILFTRKNNLKEEEKNLSVNIPQGFLDGKKLKIFQEGHQYYGKKGDLFIQIKIKKHPLFKISKEHLIMNLPISVSDAILGAQVTVPTLVGQAQVTIPAGVSSGSLLKLSHQGFYSEDGRSRGNLILEISIDIPSQINEEEKTWFKEFRLKKNTPPAVARFNIQMQKLLSKRSA